MSNLISKIHPVKFASQLFNGVKRLARPKLKLVRGTRLTSGLFIGASIALAAGILWAANMYYDIDTSTVMVGEKQQVTGLFTATTTQITGQSGSPALTITQTGTGYGAIITGGRVGIATSTPRYAFDVWGDLGVGTSTDTNTPALYVDSGTGGRIGIGTTTLYGLLTVGTTTPSLVVSPTGKVGIATTSPSHELGVQGDLFVSGNIYGNIAGAAGGWVDDGTVVRLQTQTDNVGIGTTTPRYNLDVWGDFAVGTSTATNIPILYVDSGTGYGSVGIGTTTPTGLFTVGTSTPAFVVTSAGTVGIGTSTPSALLAIQGNIIGSGNMILYGSATSTFGGGIRTAGDIAATGGSLSIYLTSAGALTLQPQSNSDVVVQLGGTGQLKIGSSGQFYIDASGNATTSGNIYASSFMTIGANATVRKTGEQVVRGVAPIFGFDLPARCNTTCIPPNWATTTRTILNTDFFPSPLDGTTRKYRFSIRYASASSTASSVWQIATSSDNSSYQFTLNSTGDTDINKGFATTTNAFTSLPVNGESTCGSTNCWFLRVQLPLPNSGWNFQVYEILLIGLDEVN